MSESVPLPSEEKLQPSFDVDEYEVEKETDAAGTIKATRTKTALSKTEWIHIALGVVGLIPWVLQGTSGALLVFEEDIDRWIHHDAITVSSEGPALDLDAQLDRLEQQRPGTVRYVYGVRLPDDEREATLFLAKPNKEVGPRRGVRYAVDPYTGNVRLEQRYGETFTGRIYNFHRTFCLPPWGAWITSTSAILLAIASFGGIVLALRRFRARRRRAQRPKSRWLHQRIGALVAPIVMIIALNGVIVTYRGVANKVIFAVTRTDEPESMRQRDFRLEVPEGQARIPLDDLIAMAKEREPAAMPRVLLQPRVDGRPVTVMLQKPNETRDIGGTFLIMNPYSGETMERIDFTDGALGPRVIYWTLHLHKGTWGGVLFGRWGALATRVLWVVAALCVPLLALSGFRWWWVRRRQM
ncbi:MAG: PepSY-associated TM helix domain-containing protein [Myxococcota bacterium]